MLFFVEVIKVTFLVSVMLKLVGHQDSNSAICPRPILIDISILTLSVASIPVTTFGSRGVFLVSRGCFARISPRSLLHVCKLRTHLVKPDGFRVSLVSPPARWPYLKNVDSIIMPDQTAFHMPWLWGMTCLLFRNSWRRSSGRCSTDCR